ncbi:MAG: 5-dehydro-2-deoxygluconokinase [Actinomycetota bacterium]
MTESIPQVLTVGRVSVDLYAQQSNASATHIDTFKKSIGGTSTNVAVAAARLGVEAATFTKVGDDEFGDYVRYALRETFGVDSRWIGTDPELLTPLAFAILDPPEDPRIVFYREPSAPDLQILDTEIPRDVIEQVPVLWVPASRFHAEPSATTVGTLLEWRGRRPHTVIDLDWRPMFWDGPEQATAAISPMLEHFTIAVGNREECDIAVGERDPDRAADALLDRGLEAAIVKLGADGVMVATRERREVVPPFLVDVVCGLGSGDAFGGALVHGLVNDHDLVDSVRNGNAAGAIVAGRLMCADDMPTLEEIHELRAARS